MRALIAAGGRSTRLRPITWTINKHLIPLANKPMLEHVIEKITEAGITEIAININPGETEVMTSYFGNGSRWGAKITYIEQVGGAKGIAHAVDNAKSFLSGDSFLFFLGDNIVLGSIKHMKEKFEQENLECLVALSRVKDPQRFGVPEFDENKKIVRVIEKPADPPSPFAVTGIYFFSPEYFDGFKTIQPSARGEYEITDMITWYIQRGKKVGYEEITGWWKDTGTPEALIEGNALIMADTPKSDFIIESEIPVETQVQGYVKIGKNVKITADSLIRGPVVIGDNCEVVSSYVGPYTSIGEGSVIRGAEIEHSIIFRGVKIDTPIRVVDSLLGQNAQLVDARCTHPKSGHRMVIGDNSRVEL
jgi:glucose-1-phosphate thymidylyltransferase